MKVFEKRVFFLLSVVVMLVCVAAVPVMAESFRTVVVECDELTTGFKVVAPEKVLPNQLVKVEVTEPEEPYIFDSVAVSRLDVYDLDDGEFLFSVDGDEFKMPQDHNVRVKILQLTTSKTVVAPTLAPPKPFRTVVVECDSPIHGFEVVAPEKVFPGQPVKVEVRNTDNSSVFSAATVSHLDIYNLADGEFLFSVDGDEFEMPLGNEVLVKVQMSPIPKMQHVVTVEPEHTTINGVGVDFKASGNLCEGAEVTVTAIYPQTENNLRVDIMGLDIYTDADKLLFSTDSSSFIMPDADVRVKVVFAAACAVNPTPTPVPVSVFKDVSASTSHYDAIAWAKNAGVTKGYSDGTFQPSRNCSRGDMIMFLWGAAGKPAPKSVSASPFKDVPKTHKYYRAILWAYQRGITKGYSDGTFKVDKAVTRGEAVRFLWNMKGSPKPKSTKNPFKDLAKTYTHYNAVLWAYHSGIVKGYGDGTFRCNNNATRGDAVELLYRLNG